MDDLFKAMGMFKDGMQQLAVTKGINDAHAEVDSLKQGELDIMQQRSQQTQIANRLASQLAGMGATGQQIQTAHAALAPQQIKSSADAQRMALESGNPQMLDFAGKLQKQELDQARQEAEIKFAPHAKSSRETALIGERSARTVAEIGADSRMQARLAEISKSLAPKAGEVSFDTNVDMGIKFADELSDTVKKVGTWEGKNMFSFLSDKKNAGKLDSLPYQFAITYAKIVDPDSVAREGEVAAAQKYLVNLGITASEEAAQEQIKHMKDTILQYKQSRSAAKAPMAPKSAVSGRPFYVPDTFVQQVDKKTNKLFWVDPSNPSKGFPAE